MHDLSRWVGRAVGMRPRLIPPAQGSRAGGSPRAPRVAVVGGGVAGISAAVVLAERGIRVEVCEAADRLGGRLDTSRHVLPDGTPQNVDHGFHAFFRQYYNWRRILRRAEAGPPAMLHPLDRYPVVSKDWPEEDFDRLPPSPPVSLLALLRRSPSLRLRDLRHADPAAARALLGYDPQRTYARLDNTSAAEMLDALRLSERARSMLFDVFAHSFFNAAETMSAADLVAMFHFYFLGNPEGLGMDAPHTDYENAIWAPLARYLQERGATISLSSPVEAICPDPAGSWRLQTGSGPAVHADEVVLACSAPSASAILRGSPGLTAADARLANAAEAPLAGPPYAVARYWLSGGVDPRRAPFTGIGNPDLLDSVTAYHLFDEGARRWHRDTGGSVLELHAYACPDLPPEQLGRSMLHELGALWPETRGLRVVDRRCHLGHDAAGFPVGSHSRRPGVYTAVPHLRLAGDWIAAPIPCALMERSAVTGILAANAILRDAGHAAEPIWSVPGKGMLARRPRTRRASESSLR